MKKRVLETLCTSKILYYDADAGEGRKKERLSFLGREMDFPTGMIHLAHRANATIIPLIPLYRKGKTTLILKSSIDGHWREGKGAYKRIITEFKELLESYILTYPEQYLGIYGPTVLAYYYRGYQKD